MTRDPYGDEPARTLADPYGDAPETKPVVVALGSTASTPGKLDWRKLANCRNEPTDWWYPPPPKRGADFTHLDRAKALCGTCPVRTACLAEATATCEGFGIWGGTSPPARSQLRKRAKAEGVPLDADAIAAWVDRVDALGTAVA